MSISNLDPKFFKSNWKGDEIEPTHRTVIEMNDGSPLFSLLLIFVLFDWLHLGWGTVSAELVQCHNPVLFQGFV